MKEEYLSNVAFVGFHISPILEDELNDYEEQLHISVVVSGGGQARAT